MVIESKNEYIVKNISKSLIILGNGNPDYSNLVQAIYRIRVGIRFFSDNLEDWEELKDEITNQSKHD